MKLLKKECFSTTLAATAAVALLAISPSLRASITRDTNSSKSQGPGTSIAWSHTVNTGADRMLVVGIATESTVNVTVTGVSFGTATPQAFTQVTGARAVNGTSPYNATDLWYLVAPAETTDTITVTFSGSVTNGAIGTAVSLFGVVQGAPEAVANFNAATPPYSATISTPLTDGAWLVDILENSTQTGNYTPTSGQTELWDIQTTFNHSAAGSTREVRTTTPATTVTDTWTSTGTSRSALSVAAFAPVSYTVPPLAADAGPDKTVSPSVPAVQIGGTPAASGGYPLYTYSWSPADGLSSTSVPNPTASPTSTTTYTLTVTDSASPTPVTVTDSVTVNYPLAANAGPDQLCTPLSPTTTIGATNTANGGTGPYTYLWVPSTGLDDATAANPTASPSTTTTYTVTVTDSLNATSSDSVIVTYAVPDPNLISVDFVYSSGSVVCSGNTVLTSPVNPATDPNMKNAAGEIYTGQVGPWNAVNTGGNNANTTSASLANLVNGAGTVTTVAFKMGTATSAGGAGGGWRNNSIGTLIPGSLRHEMPYLYYPTLTANHYNWELTGLEANAHYRLTLFGDTSTTYTNVANSVSPVRDSEGDWNWSDIAADGSGKILGNFMTTGNNDVHGLYGLQLYKIPVPLVADAGPDKGFTPGSPVVIGGSPAASGGTAPYTYSWSPATGLDDPLLANPTASPTTTTTYTLTVTDSASPTPATATDTVTVTYAPPLVADAGPDKGVTPEAPTVTIGGSPAASGGVPGYTYSWTPATGLSDPNVANPTASPTTTTTYTLQVTDAAFATVYDSVIVTHTVSPLVANAGADKTYNPGTPVTLGGSPAASGGSTVYTYSWSPATGLSDPNAANPTASPTTTTTYTLTVTDSLGTPAATDEVLVTFTVLPLVANAGADKSLSPGSPSAVLGGSPSASGGSTVYTYSWSPSTGLSDPNVANPTASPTATTTYTLTVTDDLGTTPATDEVLVTYTVPNMNLISVDFKEGSGTTCVGDTTLTGTTMKNAVGNVFTGQAGNWNAMNIGTYTQNSATSGFLNNAGGTATTVKLALGRATGLDNTAAGGWRCSPNEGALGGADQLRSESAYLYNGVITGDHYAWALTGLAPDSTYKLTFFGDLGNAGGASNVANSVAGIRDSEGDWNWETITTDSSGTILGTFTAPNPTLGLFGLQIETLGTAPSGYTTWATTYAGGGTASEDYNNDGVSNGVAYFMGMNGLATNPGVTGNSVTWPYVNSVDSYKVQTSNDLSPSGWVDVATNDPKLHDTGLGGSVTYDLLPAEQGRLFVRLVVTP